MAVAQEVERLSSGSIPGLEVSLSKTPHPNCSRWAGCGLAPGPHRRRGTNVCMNGCMGGQCKRQGKRIYIAWFKHKAIHSAVQRKINKIYINVRYKIKYKYKYKMQIEIINSIQKTKCFEPWFEGLECWTRMFWKFVPELWCIETKSCFTMLGSKPGNSEQAGPWWPESSSALITHEQIRVVC